MAAQMAAPPSAMKTNDRGATREPKALCIINRPKMQQMPATTPIKRFIWGMVISPFWRE